jgi:hypothetical protein
LRPRIVLACADGRPNPKIADELGGDRATVGKWRHRFAAERLGSTHRGQARRARSSDEVVEAVVVETLETTLVVDDVLPPWQPRAVEVRGQAGTLEIGGKAIMEGSTTRSSGSRPAGLSPGASPTASRLVRSLDQNPSAGSVAWPSVSNGTRRRTHALR